MGEWDLTFGLHTIDKNRLAEGIPLFILLRECGLCETGSEARRAILNGGLYIMGEHIREPDFLMNAGHYQKWYWTPYSGFLIKMGKRARLVRAE